MKTRPYRGKLIPVKKGGVNLQLCAQEKTLLKSLLEEKIDTYMTRLEIEKNKVIKRDLTYYQKIYSKLTKKKQCPNCREWI